ncbi:hypothetical protein AB6805_29660 [Chitinophaga sp. RCC_12]|uniref:hypothetical protein n=1 Tax=Chitinophaga sp. RCC_12 TaxID=3239226 RepID=UPI003523415B
MNNNYIFSDDFFAHIRAPKYQLQKVSTDTKGLGIFPPLDEIKISFVENAQIYYSAAERGLTVYSQELITDNNGNVTGAVMYMNIPAAVPRVQRVKGLVIPWALSEKITPWDVMGMEGNLHGLEGLNGYRDDAFYGQCVHSSYFSHDGEGESHPSGVIRFGIMYQVPQPRRSIYEKDTYTYTVDYKHLYVSPVHISGSLVETLKTQCWPGNLDFSILHRPAGTYEVEKKGEHILFRVL